MGFKINNNLNSLGGLRQLGKNQEVMANLLDRLSSGRRITGAEDDAAGLAASTRMRAEIGSLNVAVRNTLEAGSALQTAEGGIQQAEEILIRMKELATQAAGAGSDQNRAVTQEEVRSLQAELDRIAGATTYNDQALLDGNYDQIFQVGGENSAESQISVTMQGVSTATLNNGGQLNVDVSTQVSAQNALSDIDSAINTLAEGRAEIGVYQNRIDYAQSNLLVSIENKIAAESTLADTDMAADMSEFMKTQILLQADTAMLAQANQVQSFMLDIFK